MKIKHVLAAAALLMGTGGAMAQTDAEYAAANAEIEANGVYKIYTLSNGSTTGETKYYLKTNGYLTDDANAAGTFTFDMNYSFETFKYVGYRLNKFSNGGGSASGTTLKDEAKKHIMVENGNNRVTYEAQVFFKNDDGYAIRSTNVNGSGWGASAFWTVVEDNDGDNLPNATYTFESVPYVWQLEKVTAGDFSDVTSKFITNYQPTSTANEAGWTVTQGSSLGSWDGHNFGDEVAEFYRRSGGGIAQTLNELPKGFYTLTAYASMRDGTGGSVSINGISQPIVSLNINSRDDANKQFKAGNGKNVIDFALDATSNVPLELKAGTTGDAWTVYRAFFLTYNSEPVSLRKALAEAKTNANNALASDNYTSVTGIERTQLQASVAKTVEEGDKLPSALVTEYKALIDEIGSKLTAFQEAPAYYTQLAAENSRAAQFNLAAQSTESQSAKDAVNVQAQAVYDHVVTNYNTIIELGEWTKENAGDMSKQHWDGTNTTTYNEQKDGWSTSAVWNTSYSQTVTLPAGDYVFKVAGRHSQYATLVLNVKNGEEVLGTVNDFPTGDTGRGISTDGRANFSDEGTYANNGVGRGWQWRYVPFTITAETADITISVEGANPEAKQYQWVGFCNYTVQSAPSVAASTVAYNQAKAAGEEALASETYKNVQGTDRSDLDAAIKADKGTTIESIDAAAENIRTKQATFTAGVASWNTLAATRAGVSGTLPYASADKKTALDNAVAAEVAGTAADATAQVAVIEQANRQYVESNALAEGMTGSVNVTNLITNPDANDGGNGWSGSFGTRNDEQYTQGDGTLGGYYFDKNGASSYTAEQTLANLPLGTYLLSVTARAQSISGTYQLKATNSQGVAVTADIPTVGNTGGVFGRGFNDVSVVFTQNIAGAATIGITATNSGNFWMSFDRFRLVKIADVEGASEEQIAALNAQVAALKAKIGFQDGEYAPYNNIESVKALSAFNDLENGIAKSIYDEAKAQLEALTWTANEDEVNAIPGDKTFAEGSYTISGSYDLPNGWSNTGYDTRIMGINEGTDNTGLQGSEGNVVRHAMLVKFGTSYGETEGYTLPLKGETCYEFSFEYGLWNEDGTITKGLSVTAPDGTTIEMAPGTVSGNENGKANCANAVNTAWHTYTAWFKTTTAGNYVLNIVNTDAGNQRQMAFSNLELKKAANPTTLALNESEEYTPAYGYANVTLTRTFKANTWATFVVPFDIDNATLKAQLGEDVAVSTISASNKDGVTFSPMSEPAITANVPVLLKAANIADSYTFNGVFIKPAQTVTNLTDGLDLVSNYSGKVRIPGTTDEDTNAYYYISSNKLRHSTGSQTIKGFRAYFSVAADAPAGIKAFFQSGDIETGIEAVEDVRTNDEAIFNLAGQRVEKAQKGIYIVNGRKVLVK